MSDEILQQKIQGYGWKPSLPDPRDFVVDVTGMPILDEVDPRNEYMPAVYDQMQLGSCTANAVAAAIDADRIVSGEEPMYPSRLWIYALERLYEGFSLAADTGAYGRDGFRAARRLGVVPEKLFPYSDQPQFWQKNPRNTELWLQRDKIDRPYKMVPRDLTTMKRVLSKKQTIAVGFTVFESFESSEVSGHGIMSHPDVTRERVLGGHEVLLVGYLKDEPNYALARNSWSEHWGIGGYFLMPWSVILDPNLSDDFRTIYRPSI